MNGAVLQRIVEEIVSRLQRRAHSTATLSVAQLRDADCRSLFCQHASLRILLVDLPLLNQLAERSELEVEYLSEEPQQWRLKLTKGGARS